VHVPPVRLAEHIMKKINYEKCFPKNENEKKILLVHNCELFKKEDFHGEEN